MLKTLVLSTKTKFCIRNQIFGQIYPESQNRGEVACYIRRDITFNFRDVSKGEVLNVLLISFSLKVKPFSVGIIYQPQMLTLMKKTILIGDFNTNLIYNNKCLL